MSNKYKCSHSARGLESSTHTWGHKRAYLKGHAWQAMGEVKTNKHTHSMEVTKIWTCQLAEKMRSREEYMAQGNRILFWIPMILNTFLFWESLAQKMLGEHRLIHLYLYIFIYKFLHFLKGKKINNLNFFLGIERVSKDGVSRKENYKLFPHKGPWWYLKHKYLTFVYSTSVKHFIGTAY